MNKLLKSLFLCFALIAITSMQLRAQTADSSSVIQEKLLNEIHSLRATVNNYRHTYDIITKKVDDLMWHKMLEDITYIDKVPFIVPF